MDVAESKEELSAWEDIQERLQNLRPADAKRKALESEEIPALETKLKELDKHIPEFRLRADEVCPSSVLFPSTAHCHMSHSNKKGSMTSKTRSASSQI